MATYKIRNLTDKRVFLPKPINIFLTRYEYIHVEVPAAMADFGKDNQYKKMIKDQIIEMISDFTPGNVLDNFDVPTNKMLAASTGIIRVSPTDIGSAYLEDKISAGSGIDITVQSLLGQEFLRISNTADSGLRTTYFDFHTYTGATTILYPLLASSVVMSVSVVVTEIFDGFGPTMSIGTTGNLSLFLDEPEIDLLQVGQYSVDATELIPGATNLLMTLDTSFSVTGAGYVVVTVMV